MDIAIGVVIVFAAYALGLHIGRFQDFRAVYKIGYDQGIVDAKRGPTV